SPSSRSNKKAAEAFVRLGGFSKLNFLLNSSSTHPERIERRLVDHCRHGESLISLISGDRLPGQWPEQSVHFTSVIAHLLQLGLHVRDHAVGRFSTMTNIDRGIVGIILGARIVTPCRIPVTIVPVIVTATDQLHAGVMRAVPAPIMPFRMIRSDYFVLRTLPALASLIPITLVERDRRNFVRSRLGFEIHVLLFDLLHLLLDLLHLLRIRFDCRIAARCLLAG